MHLGLKELTGFISNRKACLNIMDLHKRKQEVGIWLEMELNTIEDSSIQDKTLILGASRIIMTNNFIVYQSKVHPSFDDPSKQSSLIGTMTMPNENGHHENSNHNKFIFLLLFWLHFGGFGTLD
jgi:hypothetical protein